MATKGDGMTNIERTSVVRRLPARRGIYQRHGGVRYATRARLAMEERLVAQAGVDTAPRLTLAAAARAIGAHLARLEDTLTGRAQEIQGNHPERTGLTPDQAAAVLSVLTDGQRVL